MATEVEKAVVAVGYSYDRQAERTATVGIGKVLAAATAATAAIVGLARNQAAANDEFAKTARDLDVGVARLQAYEMAAGLAGVQIGELRAGLGTLQRSIVQAAKGTGDQAALFRRMGIEAVGSDGSLIGVADAFDLISDRIDRLGSTADQSAALQLLLGGRGLTANRIRGLLAGGSEGIAEVEQRMRSMGAVLSEDVAKASEDLTDQFSWLGTAFQGVANDVFEDVIPALIPLVETITELISDSEGLVRTLSRGFGDVLGAVFRGMNTDAGLALAGIVAVGGAIGSIGAAGSLVAAAGAAVPVIGGVTAALSGAAVPALALSAVLGGVFVALDQTADSSTAAATGTKALTEQQRAANEEAEATVGWWDAIVAVYDTATLGLRALGLTIAETAGYAAGLTMQAWDMVDPFIDLVRQLPGIQTLEQVLRSIGNIWGEMFDGATDFERFGKTINATQERFQAGDFFGGLGVLGSAALDNAGRVAGVAAGELETIGRQQIGIQSERAGQLGSMLVANERVASSWRGAAMTAAAAPLAIERGVYNITIGSVDEIAATLDAAYRTDRATVLAQVRAATSR